PTVCPSATVTLYRVHFDTASSAKTSTPSLLDALPIFSRQQVRPRLGWLRNLPTVSAKTVQQTRMVTKLQKVLNLRVRRRKVLSSDRKSTRLNSSHVSISYAVCCLKTK